MLAALLLWCFAQAQGAPAPQTAPSGDDGEVRLAVQQYYDAQAARDPDKAASFWSASANPRVTRDTFVVLFGPPAEDTYRIEVRSVTVTGADARVRVMWVRTRLETRDGQPFTSRKSDLDAQTWRKEDGAWKLLRDAPFASELADEYLALPEPDRAGYLVRQTPNDLAGLRYEMSQRATTQVTLRKDYAAGRTLFERALEISRAAGDHVGEANSLHNIAQADYVLHEFAAATDNFEKELAVGHESGDDSIAAGALYGLGTVAYAGGDYSKALVSYNDALAIYVKRDDGSSANRALISIGNIQYLQADYDAADASYRRAESLATSGFDPQGATLARAGLARVLAAQGDLAAALAMYGRVLADARAAYLADGRLGNGVATTLESIGEVHFRLGNMDQARAAFEEARRLVDADPDFSGRLYSSLGLTELVAGRDDAALTDYTESRARYVKAKDAPSAGRAWIGIGFAQAAREKWDLAIAAYNSAVTELEEHASDRARAWLGLSLAQSGAGDNTAALDSARKVLAIADTLKSPDLSWRGNVRAGEALTRLAKFDDARASFQSAIDVISQLAADAPVNPEARSMLSDTATAWAGLAVALAKSGDARAALDAAEARRAHVRRTHLAAFQADITRGESDQVRADEQALARDIIATRNRLTAEAGAAHPDDARVNTLTDQMKQLTARRAALQAQLYADVPALAEWRGVTPVGPVDLEALVPDARKAAVEYLMTDEELLVLVVTRGESGPEVSSAIMPLTRHGLAENVAAAMKPAVLSDAAAWRGAADKLRGSLLASIADRLRDRDACVFVPDDVIWKVPLEALSLDSPQSAPDGDTDLGSRMRVTYATSFATLAVQRRITRPSAPGPGAERSEATAGDPPRISAAFIAAPALPDAMRDQLALTQPGWKEPDAALAQTRAQADAQPYGDSATVKSGSDATKPALGALFKTVDVLQIEAPVHVSGPSPLFSSVLLAGTSSSAPDDVRWEAREWFAVDGRVRTLVFDDASAFGGAGVSGAMDTLAWAAAAAGVSTIVVARWPSDAFSLDAVESQFHAELAKDRDVADAWHTAVVSARSKSAAPAAWAGLRLIGGL
jgi:tetratricopeptide (TPR) repeat protein